MTELDKQKKIPSLSMLPWLSRIRNLLAICLIITTIFIVVYSYISIKGVIEFTVNSATQTASDIALSLREKSLRTAREQLAAEADSKAHQIGKELEKAVTAITTLAQVLSGMVEEQVVVDVGRDVVNGMLHTILSDNTKIFGVYTVWEPDSFDMLDLAYAGSALHDNTGRFIPYWYRNTDNTIIGKPCEDYDNQNTDKNGIENESFYLLPKKTRQIHIIGPRRIVIGKNEVLTISIVAPIIVENKFLGITGIDLNLDFLQKIIRETSFNLLQKQGKLRVLNHGGFIVVSNTSNDEIGQSLQAVLIKHSKHKTMEEEVITYTPIIIDRFLTPWSIRIAIPQKILRSDADAIYKTMMDDTDVTSGTLNRKSMSALWKLGVSGILLVVSTLSIILLIRTLERKESALKTSEKKYRNLIENTSDIHYQTDLDGRIIFVSQSVLSLSGYTVEEAIGMKMVEEIFLNPEERTDFLQALQKNGFISDFEAQLKRKDGTVLWASTNAHFYKDEGGNTLGVEGVTRDITDRQQAEEEKIKSLVYASKQEKLAFVGKIAGKMAHDFNNILGIIMGNTELSLLDCKDAEIKKTLELIFEQTLRGKNLTKNLVAFAKDQEPKQQFFSVNKKNDLVLNLLQKDLEKIDVIKEGDHGIPDLLADPGMIEHALVNLIQNSIHATSMVEQPRIVIRSFHKDKNIYIEIEDNGCGISEEALDRIYEPAFTMKGSNDITNSYNPDIKGTGYGMANVKKYIEQHKGNIVIDSKVGKGTKVTISFPVINKELTEKEIIEIKKETIYFEKYILLVEDESAISDVQYKILTHQPCNHKVDIAATGQIAVDLFSKNKYDFVCLDYILPEKLNGMDVYKHIRQTNDTIPILFVSGNLDFLESIKELKHKDPYVDHISKPCQNKDYVCAINELFGKI